MQRLTSLTTSRKSRLWLASVNGRAQPFPPSSPTGADRILPERVLIVQFEGLTDAEQRSALAAFPGGRRFVLAS